jgi:hypothetical protein
VVGTPRSGNSWLRMLLDGLYACDSLACHTPAEVPWDALPADLVLQMHQRPSPFLQSALKHWGFRIVVLARHPLDVLVSILHFTRHEPGTARWLEGQGGDERGLAGCAPTDRPFLEYATCRRATALLAVGKEWWTQQDVMRVRFEELCSDTSRELTRLAAQLAPAKVPVETVVQARSPTELQRIVPPHHVWQARPGNWRGLVPADVAHAIADAHQETFELLGYDVDPDPKLDAASARANWARIATSATTDPADWATAAHDSTLRETRRLRASAYAIQQRLDEERRARQESERTVRVLTTTVEALRAGLATVDARHDELQKQVTALRAESAWRQEVEASLSQEIDWHRKKAAELERRLEAERAHAVAAEVAAARVASSRSFRYTAPLRSLARLMRLRRRASNAEMSRDAGVESPR